jgi:hypothetical protein
VFPVFFSTVPVYIVPIFIAVLLFLAIFLLLVKRRLLEECSWFLYIIVHHLEVVNEGLS